MKTVDDKRAEILSDVAQKIIEAMNAERLSSNEALIILARLMGQCEAHGLLRGEMLGNPDTLHAEVSRRIAEERDEYIEYARKAEQSKKES